MHLIIFLSAICLSFLPSIICFPTIRSILPATVTAVISVMSSLVWATTSSASGLQIQTWFSSADNRVIHWLIKHAASSDKGALYVEGIIVVLSVSVTHLDSARCSSVTTISTYSIVSHYSWDMHYIFMVCTFSIIFLLLLFLVHRLFAGFSAVFHYIYMFFI